MALQPIFIFGPHKSGTSLLRNLFDGIEGHFVCPVETHFFQLLGKWVEYDLRRNFPENISKSDIYHRFVRKVEQFNNRENPLGDSDLRGSFDISKFEEKFKGMDLDSIDDGDIVDRYFHAIYYSLYGQELPTNKVIHKTVGLAEHAQELKKLFPQAKFVHVVRNPYANLVAFRKFRTSNGPYPLLNRLISSLNNNFYFLYKNLETLPDYHVVRYEDLVTSPKETMKGLSDKLDIPFEAKMLVPTSLGKDWQGNSTSQEPMTGVDNTKLEVWKKSIHPVEAYFINKNFPFVLEDYGYSKFPAKGFWKPAKKENWKRYLYNRIFRFYNRKYIKSSL